MSSQTKIFYAVQERINELGEKFLPEEFDDFGDYGHEVNDLAKAYCLFVHAELENFLEKVSYRFVFIKHECWANTGAIDNCILSIFLCCAFDKELIENSCYSEGLKRLKKGDVSFTANVFVNQVFKSVVIGNNGIKKPDIKKIFMPTGLLPQIEKMNIECLNEFGKIRGGIAHSNHFPAFVTQVDPFVYYNTVRNEILPLVEAIDALLVREAPSLSTVEIEGFDL